ncbi:hypothetical protein D3C87_1824810 [compost metagenome]
MQTFEAILHFDNQALGGFFANARQFDQRSGIFTLNGIHKLLGRHTGQNGQRQLRTDAVSFNQFAEQHTFLLIIKAVQELRIFTHHELGEDNRLFP